MIIVEVIVSGMNRVNESAKVELELMLFHGVLVSFLELLLLLLDLQVIMQELFLLVLHEPLLFLNHPGKLLRLLH